MSNPEEPQPGLTPHQYRRLVIETTANMLGILSAEMTALSNRDDPDPLQQAHMIISMTTIASLQELAVSQERRSQDLVVVDRPKLVDQDGRPINRQAGRLIEREMGKIDGRESGEDEVDRGVAVPGS